MFKNSHVNFINIDIRNVILLDSQSTIDLIFNTKLVGNIYKAKKNMRLQSNRGKIIITHMAQVDGYKPNVWFDLKASTNLIDLKNIIKQYRVN